MIGELNSRITIKTWGSDQDEIGAPVKVLAASYNMWAKVESRSGHLYVGQEQPLWNYDYKITFRYERSRPVASNSTIDYDNKRLAINSVSFENEGKRFWTVVRCATTDETISSTDGEIQPDLIRTLSTYSYTGTGSEVSFTTDLINKKIIGAFKDGVGFEVLIESENVLTPVGKQVVYVQATGIFKWGVAYTPNEYTLIQYI